MVTITIEEVGRELGLSRASVYTLIKTGALKAVKTRPRAALQVTSKDLEAYVRRLRNQTPPRASAAPLIRHFE